jgi:carbon storage regulator
VSSDPGPFLCQSLLYVWRSSWAENYKGHLMLILTRRQDESLRIGDEVTIKILGIRGKQIRLGVMAPKNVSVHRQEIFERMQRELAAQAPFQGNEMPEEDKEGTMAEG